MKRRSKSAHAGRFNQSEDEETGNRTAKIAQPKSITFNLNQNKTLEYKRQQFFEQPAVSHSPYGSGGAHFINSGMHTNVM